MEEKKTTRQYKRTLRSTVGTGMSALAGGNGRRFYVLEHRDSSKYHRAGESQKIIIDQIELGCNPDCQVRYDQETWGVVSRRHAAIEREGNRWKLIHLSATNSTFLNGRKIESEWYLENGDEIQLAVGGPRLGFIAPEGKQGLVSSIKMTERLELFRKQALKPYKRAIAAMAIILVLAIGGLGTWNILLQQSLTKQSEELAQQTKRAEGNEAKMDSLNSELVKKNKEIGDIRVSIDNIRNRATRYVRPQPVPTPPKPDTTKINPDPGPGDLNKCLGDVYHVEAVPCINGESLDLLGWSGTGFLLNNGTFVTAQHMVHIDEFGTKVVDDPENPGKKKRIIDEESILTQLNALYYASLLTIKMTCTSSSGSFTIEYSYNDNTFTYGRSKVMNDSYKDSEGRFWNIFIHRYGGGDWAYTKVNKSGGLSYDSSYSMNLPINTQLHIFGFPSRQGAKAQGKISPIYSQAVTSRAGLEDDGTIKTSNDNTDHGNSGGPVLINKNGKYTVIGILSGANMGSDASHRKGRVIPIGAAL